LQFRTEKLQGKPFKVKNPTVHVHTLALAFAVPFHNFPHKEEQTIQLHSKEPQFLENMYSSKRTVINRGRVFAVLHGGLVESQTFSRNKL
jgi:hypothetical protein